MEETMYMYVVELAPCISAWCRENILYLNFLLSLIIIVAMWIADIHTCPARADLLSSRRAGFGMPDKAGRSRVPSTGELDIQN